MPTNLCFAQLVRRDWLTDGPLNKLLALYIEALQSKRSARGVVATPRVLRYPSATEPFRSAASTAEA